MSEGELKREIYKTAEYEHDRGLRSVRVEFVGEIEYILDEAKQDFYALLKTEKGFTWQMLEEMVMKWFGEAEK